MRLVSIQHLDVIITHHDALLVFGKKRKGWYFRLISPFTKTRLVNNPYAFGKILVPSKKTFEITCDDQGLLTRMYCIPCMLFADRPFIRPDSEEVTPRRI